ncbi:MAG: hypothetical protein IJP68_11855, partial [Selenomonadaceae bacterium]|nr:hypothetical protein [Selenomonadaceae bacterium]
PNFDEEDDDELIDPPETTAEVNDLPEVKPEFKRYGSFKVKAAHIDAAHKAASFNSKNRSRDKPQRKEVMPVDYKILTDEEHADMCWELIFKRYHKHRWHIGRDSWDDPYPYYLDKDGEEVEADIYDDDECREVEEQLGLIYADKRDYTGLSGSGWYAEDDPRLKDGYNESYSWREGESDYYRDVL